ncbi:MAG: tetratricopeptide repeat protein [Spirochaetales bacterium]|jgi:tetratricopeptide (TPR) repeat protein|nr:tetratricopeptide repeat protein [Spirochaetales bacterium]
MKASFRNAVRLYNSKRYEMALEEFNDLKEDPALNPELSYYLGLCYTQLQKYEEALLFLEQVVTTGLNILHIYQSRMILSYIYTITGRYKLAEFELESLLDSGYESAQVYAAFGFVTYESGNIDDALAYFKKALGLDPENSNAMNSLGYVLAQENRDLDYALALCRRAVDLRPENPAYIDSLGCVYLKKGSVLEARNQFRRALSLSAGNKDIAAHMKAALSSKV